MNIRYPIYEGVYRILTTNRLSLSNFAKSESDDGKELTSSDHSVP